MNQVLMSSTEQAISACLAQAHAGLAAGRLSAAVELVDSLEAVRCEAQPEVWRDEVRRHASHPVLGMLREDPYIGRAYLKPRGFAGDAVMLDYVYRYCGAPAGTTALGASLLKLSVGTDIAEAVRTRLQWIAQEVERAAAARVNARVVSIACGHLRELGLLNKETIKRIGEYTAIDQDDLALECVRGSAPESVQCVRQTIRAIIAGQGDLARGQDLVYSAGLFDYLDDASATAALKALSAVVAIGGRLVVANLSPVQSERAYLEMVASWFMVYRTEDDLRALGAAAGLETPQLQTESIARDRVTVLSWTRSS